MDVITSTANEKVKAVRRLKDKKYRREDGLFVVEGVNIVKDMPKTAKVDCFFAEQGVYDSVKPITDGFSAPVFVVTQSVFKSLSDTVTPSGLLAVVVIPSPKRSGGNALILDGVSDSGNLGTLIRTAAAADFKDLLLVGCADAYSGKVVRATMSGIFKVNIFEVSKDEALKAIEGYESYALDMDGTPIGSVQRAQAPVAVIMGSEAHGVSQEFLSAARHTVAIPMQNGVESLNVAVAGAIAMYNLAIL